MKKNCFAFLTVLIAISGFVFGQTTQPTSQPDNNQTVMYISGDVAKLLPILKKQVEQLKSQSAELITEKPNSVESMMVSFMEPICKVAAKANRVNSLVIMNLRKGPGFSIDIYGSVELKDIEVAFNEVLASLSNIPDAPKMKLNIMPHRNEKGIYYICINNFPMFKVVVGNECPEFPNDLIRLQFNNPRLKKYFASPVKIPTDWIKKLSLSDDSIFCIAVKPAKEEGPYSSEAPEFIWGQAGSDLLVHCKFQAESAEIAKKNFDEIMNDKADSSSLMKSFFSDIKIDSNEPTILEMSIDLKKFVPEAICAMKEARKLAKQALMATNLNAIGKAVILYMYANDDKFPTNPAVLVEEGYASTKMFEYPGECKKVTIENGQLTGDVHIDFFPPADAKNAPKDTIIATEKPELVADRDIIWILEFSGAVKKITKKQLKERLIKQGSIKPEKKD